MLATVPMQTIGTSAAHTSFRRSHAQHPAFVLIARHMCCALVRQLLAYCRTTSGFSRVQCQLAGTQGWGSFAGQPWLPPPSWPSIDGTGSKGPASAGEAGAACRFDVSQYCCTKAAATAQDLVCRVRYITTHSAYSCRCVGYCHGFVARYTLHAARHASDFSAHITAMLAVGEAFADPTPLLHLQVPQAADVCEDSLCRACPAGESMLHCAHCILLSAPSANIAWLDMRASNR